MVISVTLTAIAASILVILAYSLREPDVLEVAQDLPTLSIVTKISLVGVGYPRIEADLDHAEAKAEEVSEGLELAAVRLEIRESLEEFYHWSK